MERNVIIKTSEEKIIMVAMILVSAFEEMSVDADFEQETEILNGFLMDMRDSIEARLMEKEGNDIVKQMKALLAKKG